MLDQLLSTIAALGSAGVQDVLASAGESALKKYKDAKAWENLLVGTGEFFAKFEQDESSFFEDLALVLSKENLSQIAKDLQPDDGYDLKYRLYKSLMQLMTKYEIPYETAESYTLRIIGTVLEQLQTINPDKYEHFFLQEWRDEQEKSFQDLQNRIDKMSRELEIYQQERIAIASSGQMDIELRRSTQDPSIGIEFFIIYNGPLVKTTKRKKIVNRGVLDSGGGSAALYAAPPAAKLAL